MADYSTPVVNPGAPSPVSSGGLTPLSINYTSKTGSQGGSSASSEVLPSWYLGAGKNSTDYFNQFLQNQLPTGGYTGERVAGLDPYQQLGIGQAPGYLDTSSPLYGQGADAMGAGASMISGSANWSEPEMMKHLNPYLTGALTSVSNLANQNLMENVMPGVNSTFTGAGQFGSTRNADFLNRAIRDNQQTISNTQGTMINAAYDNAANDYYRWGQQGLQAGTALGGLGQQMGAYGITGLNTGMNLGGLNQQQQQQQYDAAQQAWLDQFKTPLDAYNSLAGGYNTSVGRLTNQGSRSESNYGSDNSVSYSF